MTWAVVCIADTKASSLWLLALRMCMRLVSVGVTIVMTHSVGRGKLIKRPAKETFMSENYVNVLYLIVVMSPLC